jgi:hypothetical protein
MIRAADHAAFVSKLKVPDQQLAPLVPFYHVRNADSYFLVARAYHLQVALAQLKGTFSREN